jgi:integrase
MASIIPVGDSWRATVRKKGHKQQSKSFTTKGKAATWAKSLEASIEAGTPQFSSDYTVSNLIDEYRKRREVSRPILHGSNTEYMLRHLDQGLGQYTATKMTVDDISKWVSTRLKNGGGKLALGMELILLKTVFKLSSAFLNITLPNTVGNALILLVSMGDIRVSSTARERRLEGDEGARLHEVLSQQMQDVVLIARILGFRRGEILALKWADLDRQNKMLWVRNRKDPKQKQGNDFNIPLVLGSYEVIVRQPQVSEKIFPNLIPENVSDLFLKACRELGIEDLHFHDLRHEAISCLFEAGLEIQEVALISGHKDWRNLRRYTNLKPASLHDKLDTLMEAV